MVRTPDEWHAAWNYVIWLCLSAAMAGLMWYLLYEG